MSKLILSLIFVFCASLANSQVSEIINPELTNRKPVPGVSGNAGLKQERKLRVAFVYVGPVGDSGWTWSHDQGRKAVEAEFGNKVITTYIENVPESPASERIFLDLVNGGNSLVFGTTFGYMEPMLSVAAINKNVRFEHASGYKKSSNMRTYEARSYEGAYLAGILAGKMTKSDILGFVAPIPIPEVIRNINSFTLGAQSINPNIRTRVVWINEWFNPSKEAEAAKLLIDYGSDVLFQNTDSTAVLEVAAKFRKRAIGWDSDMSSFGDGSHLASSVINWGPYYIKAVNDTLNGAWKSQHSWWGVKEGAIDLVALAKDVPNETKTLLENAKLGLKLGNLRIWKGPILSQDGKLVLEPNQIADDNFLQGIKFYVKGVVGKVPGT